MDRKEKHQIEIKGNMGLRTTARFQKRCAEIAVLAGRRCRRPPISGCRASLGLVKEMTAEGFYTSGIGLIDVLDFQGMKYRSEFPGCSHPEHQR